MKGTRNHLLLVGAQTADERGQSVGEEFRYGLARRLPCLLSEKKLDFGNCDKIFSTDWLSEDQVVVGTKCNKVIILVGGPQFVLSAPPTFLLALYSRHQQ